MPLNINYVTPKMMHAEIRLANPESYVRLLHAFEAVHNTFSHDHDIITFYNDDDGMSLHLDG
jgi:alkylated DNA repair dioxygenase AlkB